MATDARFFDVDERLRELSAKSEDLERVKNLVEMFRPGWRLRFRARIARSADLRSITCSCSMS